MTTRSIASCTLRTALALAVLAQSAFAIPVIGCGDGGCCTESKGRQESDSCCCSHAEIEKQSCCHSNDVLESAIAESSCCETDGTSLDCQCQCGQPHQSPVVPPADGDTQIRLISLNAWLVAAADRMLAIAVPTGEMRCQSSLLQTSPRRTQVLLCTWLT